MGVELGRGAFRRVGLAGDSLLIHHCPSLWTKVLVAASLVSLNSVREDSQVLQFDAFNK